MATKKGGKKSAGTTKATRTTESAGTTKATKKKTGKKSAKKK
jgi:hypothetical protein